MGDALGPRLERLQELGRRLNSTADTLGTTVLRVEAYLFEVCRLTTSAEVTFDRQEDSDNNLMTVKSLVYDRYNERYRFFVCEAYEFQGNHDPRNDKFTLWANAARDEKFASFKVLPQLLDKLIDSTQATLDLIEEGSITVQNILPPDRSKKKEANS